MILIWGVRRQGNGDMVEYAGYLFRQLEEDEAQVILPSVVVAEFLTQSKTQAERTHVLAELSKRFILVPFDARDAVLAAELWRYGNTKIRGQHTDSLTALDWRCTVRSWQDWKTVW